KAGIIKQGIPCVTTNLRTEALAVIRSAAQHLNSPLFSFGKEFRADNLHQDADGVSFDYTSRTHSISGLKTSLKGIFQARNASAALCAASILYPDIDDETLRRSLAKVSVPGRMQTLSENPLIIFDPAHNEQAVRALRDTLTAAYPEREIQWFLCFMADKEPEKLISIVHEKESKDIIYISLDDSRAYIPHDGTMKIIPSPETETIAEIISPDNNFIAVFTGSFRLYPAACAVSRLLLDRKINQQLQSAR
ncbi:MAG: glutamate ligase domain-containing protein, partial [Spirochaetota bacterium]